MSKTKKILSIILISLLIISTVFTLCKKIGLCAGDSSSGSLPVTPNENEFISYYFPTDLSNFVTWVKNNTGYTSNSRYNYLMWYKLDNGTPIIYVMKTLDTYLKFWKYTNTNNNSYLYNLTDINLVYPDGVYIRNSGGNANTLYAIFVDGNSYRIGSTSATPEFVKVDPSCIYFYTSVQFKEYNSSSVVYNKSAQTTPVDPPNLGHSKGGVLANYFDSSDFIEDSSEFPSLNLPSSATDFQSLWDNIKAFFERSFSNFNAWLLTMGDYLGQILEFLKEFYDGFVDFFTGVFDTLFGWLSDIFDNTDNISDNSDDIATDVHGHYEWDTNYWTESGSSNNNFWDYFDEHMDDFVGRLWDNLPNIMKEPFRIAHWFYQHGLNNNEFDFMTLIHYLFDFDKTTAYNSFSSNKYGDFLLDVKDFSTDFITSLTGVTESDRVFFTISLGEHFGVAIPDIVIDFDWYAQVKNTFLPWLMAFLYVSVVWLFIKRLPDIIRGVAGDISSFEDSLPKDFNNSSFNANTHIMTVTSGTRSRGGTSSSSVSFKVR